MKSSNLLLNYTKKNKEALPFIESKNVFYFPFDRMNSRTEHKLDFFNFAKEAESIQSLKALNLPNLSWEECCMKKSAEILALGKANYFISYSGGIDSTGLIVSLLKSWSQKDLDKITIVLTSHSIAENPDFFYNHLIGFKLYNLMAGPGFCLSQPDSIFITGELGDQLFGSDILLPATQKFGEDIIQKPYKDFSPKVLSHWIKVNNRVEDDGTKLFEYLHPIVEECPFKIKTVADFFWWINFSQKWQYVKYRFLELTNWDLAAKYGSHVIHFYDSVYFQNWSLLNPDLKIKGTWDSYKYLNKEYIYEFTKNKLDLNLLKLQSLQNTYLFTENRIATNQNYQVIKSVGELENYVRS